MEDRVRRYEDEQRSAFAELQGRAHKDRTLLFAAISHATEKTSSTANTSGGRPTPTAVTTSSSTSSAPQRSSPTKKHVTLVAAPKHSSPVEDVTMPESPLEEEGEARADRNRNDDDTDDFFTLEGYKNEEERSGPETSAFLQFSDEETSTDDSSYRDDSTLNNMHMIASSLPVNMLAARRRTQEDILNTGDQFDPQEVGASIKALALSVQDTGMFGDLPKPRIDCRPYAR
eukprot:Em0003g1839a